MKALTISVIAILITSCFFLLYSTVYFELAERHFEDERNGLTCNRPGSSCLFPDFSSPALYGIIGLGTFFGGVGLHTFEDKSSLSRKILGATAVATGLPSLLSGILAYTDDYVHFEIIMKNCSGKPCMYPYIFANLSIIEFFVISGAILTAIGIVFLVYFKKRNGK